MNSKLFRRIYLCWLLFFSPILFSSKWKTQLIPSTVSTIFSFKSIADAQNTNERQQNTNTQKIETFSHFLGHFFFEKILKATPFYKQTKVNFCHFVLVCNTLVTDFKTKRHYECFIHTFQRIRSHWILSTPFGLKKKKEENVFYLNGRASIHTHLSISFFLSDIFILFSVWFGFGVGVPAIISYVKTIFRVIRFSNSISTSA